MSRTGTLYVAGLWAVGLATGLAVATWPALRQVPAPHLVIPLGASLLVELGLAARSRGAAFASLSGGERMLGVIGAALAGFALTALLG